MPRGFPATTTIQKPILLERNGALIWVAFWGSLCIRRFVVGVGVRCGSVCGYFFYVGSGGAERMGILNIECSNVFASYLVIIFLNSGTAIANITAPNTTSIRRSVDICVMSAPSTMTFRIASDA